MAERSESMGWVDGYMLMGGDEGEASSQLS